MKGTNESAGASPAVLTIPNALSFLRILLIPVFVALIVHRPTTTAGLLVFAATVATDWVDGWVARRLGQVSDLGRILDPVADRLAIAAGLVALVIRGAFPLWAALLILIGDGFVLVAGLVPLVAWGELALALGQSALVVGWALFGLGIVEYYVAAAVYVGDIRRAIASTS